MNGFELTPRQQQELRAALRSARNGDRPKVALKINALLLLGTGWSLSEVSEALFLDDETLRKVVSRYRDGGLQSALTNKHKGSQCRLSEEEQAALCEELDSRIYLTTSQVCDFVEKTFGVKYTISGIADLLKRLGFSYKKPDIKPGKADLEKQEYFLKEFERFIANKAKNEAVFFMDAVHPAHNSMPAYGWMRKGKKTDLKSNSGRQRLNIHGAMNAETYEVVPLISESSVNSDSTISLLKYLEILYPLAAKIYVFLDNARYHYTKEIQEWEKTSRVKLIFLPSYSPELNLIERLWRVFKKNVLYNKYYETFDEFKSACNRFFMRQDDYYDEICSIMGSGLEGVTLGAR
jgi:transposase